MCYIEKLKVILAHRSCCLKNQKKKEERGSKRKRRVVKRIMGPFIHSSSFYKQLSHVWLLT